MTEWRVKYGQSETVIEDKISVEVIETANPFGSKAIIKVDDDNGEWDDKLTYATKIILEARPYQAPFEDSDKIIQTTDTLNIGTGDTETAERWQNRGEVENQGTAEASTNTNRSYAQQFVGYVSKTKENDENGFDLLDVVVYTYDQLLRGNQVSTDESGNTISTALENIIKNDTPITWNASNVDVVDDVQLTQSLQTENVENALFTLSLKSGNEDFGVNDSQEFFFRPTDVGAGPAIENRDWANFEIPERGEEKRNETTTYYDNGDKQVKADDGANKLEVQDSLNTADPVALSDQRNRGTFDTVDDAIDDAEQNLEEKEVGEPIKVWADKDDFLNASVGDTTQVTIDTRDFDKELRIAELKFIERKGLVRVIGIENKGQTDAVLKRISDRIEREELRNVNADGPVDRVSRVDIEVPIDNSGQVTTSGGDVTPDKETITNELRNQIRDGWADDGNINIGNIVVGTDNSTLSRTSNSLQNQTNSASATESKSPTSVDYTASISASNVREIGIEDTNNNLLYRGVYDNPQTITDVKITLSVPNSESTYSILTDLGRESVIDIIADDNPNLPAAYGYGDDNTDPTAGDTALGNQLLSEDLTKTFLQGATTDSEFEDITDISDTDPFQIGGGDISLEQSLYLEETDDQAAKSSSLSFRGLVSGADENLVAEFDTEGQFIEYNYNLDYKIPSQNIVVGLRSKHKNTVSNPGSFEIIINGDTFAIEGPDDDTFVWKTPNQRRVTFPDIGPGNVTVRAELTNEAEDSGGNTVSVDLDLLTVGDDRYSYNYDNPSSGSTLAGPELYPDQETITFETVPTRRGVDQVIAESNWDTTNSNQFIKLSNDGGSTTKQSNDTQNFTASFNSDNSEIIGTIGFARTTDDANDTPTSGDDGMQINSWDLFANPGGAVPDGIGVALTVSVTSRGALSGNTVEEQGALDSSDQTLTRTVRSPISATTDMRVIARERVRFVNGN